MGRIYAKRPILKQDGRLNLGQQIFFNWMVFCLIVKLLQVVSI